MFYDMITNIINQKNKIMFFIDWDNTIMPSYALSHDVSFFKNGIVDINTKAQLEDLENIVITLLTRAQEKGKVFIITNADDEWFLSSLQIFFPKLNLAIKKDRIILISAKTKYKKLFPEDNFKWKYEAFKSCINDDKSEELHIISIADGDLEEQILRAILNENKIKKYYIKTFILMSNPSIRQIKKQLVIVTERLDFVINYKDDIGIKLTTRQNITKDD